VQLVGVGQPLDEAGDSGPERPAWLDATLSQVGRRQKLQDQRGLDGLGLWTHQRQRLLTEADHLLIHLLEALVTAACPDEADRSQPVIEPSPLARGQPDHRPQGERLAEAFLCLGHASHALVEPRQAVEGLQPPPASGEWRVESGEIRRACFCRSLNSQLRTLNSIVQPLQRPLEVADRLLIQVGAPRLLSRLQQVFHRLLAGVAALIVVRELLVVCLQFSRVESFHRLGHLLMENRPSPRRAALIDRLPGKHVVEGVLLLRHHSLLVDQLVLLQLPQRTLQLHLLRQHRGQQAAAKQPPHHRRRFQDLPPSLREDPVGKVARQELAPIQLYRPG
jgi:hypothetical protein